MREDKNTEKSRVVIGGRKEEGKGSSSSSNMREEIADNETNDKQT